LSIQRCDPATLYMSPIPGGWKNERNQKTAWRKRYPLAFGESDSGHLVHN